MIRKVAIRNYRLFREFDLEFTPGVNILVGINGTGKSTLIEAINLAMTGRVNGRWLDQELSPYFINLDATREYFDALGNSGQAPPAPPAMIIDVFLEDSGDVEILRGSNNVCNEDACGVRIQAKLAQEFGEEYRSFISEPGTVKLAPTEYYNVDWLGFSGNAVTARSVPATTSVVDPTTIRLRSGIDYHLRHIIQTHLEPKERVELSRQYRSLREEFGGKEAVKRINERLTSDDDDLAAGQLSLAIDISQRYAWESSLVAHLDDLPFQFIGMGQQNTLKTLLAIGRRAEDAQVILIEEPENHLSHASLRKLLSNIEKRCVGKQVIIATHSSYVLNKLGLENLILLGTEGAVRITDLPTETVKYFKKLAGFDTLRLVLSQGAILVEGPSDELVVQRGYRDTKNKEPIEDGIDVISVGMSHKRFLDLSTRLNCRVWVVTDNDRKTVAQVRERFKDYLDNDKVSLHVGDDPELYTLEPQIVAANDLETLNAALGTGHDSKEAIQEFMLANKTTAALAIFESDVEIEMPEYIKSVFSGQ